MELENNRCWLVSVWGVQGGVSVGFRLGVGVFVWRQVSEGSAFRVGWFLLGLVGCVVVSCRVA